MTNVKIGPLAPSIYCVHQRIALQIAAAVDADQPDWRNRLAVVIARHLDAAAGRAGLARQHGRGVAVAEDVACLLSWS
jgi:hypothetical protein